MYDGTVKLGMPMRTLEGSGSFSSSRQTSAMDATFSWDAERDVSKQVGVSAKLTAGDKTKMDLTFRLPAVGKVRSNPSFIGGGQSVLYLIFLWRRSVSVVFDLFMEAVSQCCI